MAQTRRLKNYLLMPKLQLKFGIYSISLTLVFALTAVSLVYVGLSDLLAFVLEMSEIRDEIVVQLSQQLLNISLYLVFLIFLYAALNIIITIVFLHRIIGPVMAFSRHVKNLKDGQYASRVKLRSGDSFKELEAELNDLAQVLQSKEPS